MADLDLHGYGEHTLAASNDYYVRSLRGAPGRKKRLIVGVNRTAGSLTFLSRAEDAGSSFALVAQSYTKTDETVAATAISADDVVHIDATGKEIVIRTDASFAGSVHLTVERES